MPVLCPHCYAEIGEAAEECFSCGGVCVEKNYGHATIELAGSPLHNWRYSTIPVGTLIDNRFTIVQYNDILLDGHCYIAMDQVLVQKCFVLLWQEEHPIWQYHQRICLRSPVVHCNDAPYYSAFPPQEGLALLQALSELNWGVTKRWEVFRQICFLLAAFHHEEEAFGFLHPSMLWLRKDGQLEFSLQREELSGTWRIQEWDDELRNLIRILFWLFTGELEGEHWAALPLKLIPLLQQAWNNPVPAGDLWLQIDDVIRNKGYYSLPIEAKEWLHNIHVPNVVQLANQRVQVPSSMQLCAWNGIRASWRLYKGRVLLHSTIMALYESGFVEHQDSVTSFSSLRDFLLLKQENWTGVDAMNRAYILAEYGDPNQARLIIAEIMRNSRRSEDWLDLARLLFSIEDPKEGWKCITFAQKWASNTTEKLEVAAFLRWELGAISEAKKYILSWSEAIERPEDLLWIAEGWKCLFSAPKKTNQLIQKALIHAKKYSIREQIQWIEHGIVHFGEAPFLRQWLETLAARISTEEELLIMQRLGTQFNLEEEWISTLRITEREAEQKKEPNIEVAMIEDPLVSDSPQELSPPVRQVSTASEESPGRPLQTIDAPIESRIERQLNPYWFLWGGLGVLSLYSIIQWLS